MLLLDERRHTPGDAVRIAVILRVSPAALDVGHFAGEVECVETGRRGVVRSHDELVTFLRDAEAASAPDAICAPHAHSPQETITGDLQ
jgi:hypothetical protein